MNRDWYGHNIVGTQSINHKTILLHTIVSSHINTHSISFLTVSNIERLSNFLSLFFVSFILSFSLFGFFFSTATFCSSVYFVIVHAHKTDNYVFPPAEEIKKVQFFKLDCVPKPFETVTLTMSCDRLGVVDACNRNGHTIVVQSRCPDSDRNKPEWIIRLLLLWFSHLLSFRCRSHRSHKEHVFAFTLSEYGGEWKSEEKKNKRLVSSIFKSILSSTSIILPFFVRGSSVDSNVSAEHFRSTLLSLLRCCRFVRIKMRPNIQNRQFIFVHVKMSHTAYVKNGSIANEPQREWVSGVRHYECECVYGAMLSTTTTANSEPVSLCSNRDFMHCMYYKFFLRTRPCMYCTHHVWNTYTYTRWTASRWGRVRASENATNIYRYMLSSGPNVCLFYCTQSSL